MTLALHLKICGLLLLLLAAAHSPIAKRLRWKEELASVSLLTRQIFWVHSLFIVVILVQFGLLSLVFTDTLIERTLLARVVLGGLVSFWGLRLFAQHFIYSREVWQGNRFNTVVHAVFTGLWAYLATIYGVALWAQCKQV